MLMDLKRSITPIGEKGLRSLNFKNIMLGVYSTEFRLLLRYRIYSNLYKKGYLFRFLGYLMYQRTKKKYSSDIHPLAQISVPLKLGHHFGIVIGPDVFIGKNVYIFNDVTLGNKNVGLNVNQMPSIEDNVVIGVGTKILGKITVEEGSIIGASSLLINNVKKNEVWAGVPARKKYEKKIIETPR
jgi:serine O-acetyltransferase